MRHKCSDAYCKRIAVQWMLEINAVHNKEFKTNKHNSANIR
jgi:hypothetical protein